jgi:hypothetical protein
MDAIFASKGRKGGGIKAFFTPPKAEIDSDWPAGSPPKQIDEKKIVDEEATVPQHVEKTESVPAAP